MFARMILRWLILTVILGEAFLSQPTVYYSGNYYVKDYTCPFNTSNCYFKRYSSSNTVRWGPHFNFTDENGVERQIIPADGGLMYLEGVSDLSHPYYGLVGSGYLLRTDRDSCSVLHYFGNISYVFANDYYDGNVREIRKRWKETMAFFPAGTQLGLNMYFFGARSKYREEGFAVVDSFTFLEGECPERGICDYTERLLYDDTLGYIPSYENEPLFPSFGQCIPIVLEGRFTIECPNCTNYNNITYELMLINQCNETVYFEQSTTTELVCIPWNEYPCANLNRGQPELMYDFVVTVVARNSQLPGQIVRSSTSTNLHIIDLPDTDPAVKCEFNSSQTINKSSIYTTFRIDCTGLHKKFNIFNDTTPNYYDQNTYKFLKKVTVTTEMQSLVILEYIEPVSIGFPLPPGNSTVSYIVTNCENVIYQDDVVIADLPTGAPNEESFYQGFGERYGSCNHVHKLLFNDTLGDFPSYSNEPLQPSFGPCIPMMLEGDFNIECPGCVNYDNITYEMMILSSCNQTVYFEELPTTRLVCTSSNGFDCANLNRGQPWFMYNFVVTVVARNLMTPNQAVKSSTSNSNMVISKFPDTDPAVKCEFNTTQSFDNGSVSSNITSLSTMFRIDCTGLHQKYKLYNETIPNFYATHEHKLMKKVTVTTETQSILMLSYVEPISADFLLPPGNSAMSLVVTNCDNIIYQDSFSMVDLPTGAPNEEAFFRGLAKNFGSCNYIHKLLFNDTLGDLPIYSNAPLQPSFGPCIPMMLEGNFNIECPGCVNYDNITYEMMILNNCNQTVYFEESQTTRLVCTSNNGFDCANLNRGQPWFMYNFVVTVVARNLMTPNQAVKSSTSNSNMVISKFPDTDPAVKCEFNTTQSFDNGSVSSNITSLSTMFRIDCTGLHQKYKLYNETIPNFYATHEHKLMKKVTVTTETQSIMILSYVDPVSADFFLPPGNSTISLVVTNCDNVIYQDSFSMVDLPIMLSNEEIFNQGVIGALDKGTVSGNFMVSVLIENYPEMFLSQFSLQQFLSVMMKVDATTHDQIVRKISLLGSIEEEKMNNRSAEEVNVSLLLYEKTLDNLANLDGDMASEDKENITGIIFKDITSITKSMKEEQRKFDNMTTDTLQLLFDVVDKTADVAVETYGEMTEPVTLIATNTTQVVVQKVKKGSPRAIKLPVKNAHLADDGDTFFEISEMTEMYATNITFKMLYLSFNPFVNFEATVNITQPVFTVSISNEKGDQYEGKNFTIPVSFVKPTPIIEEIVTTEMSIIFKETVDRVTPVGGNLTFVVNFTMSANETKILDIKLPEDISTVMVYGQALTPVDHDTILQDGFEFPTSLNQIQKFFLKNRTLTTSKENTADYRILIPSDEEILSDGISHYDMYFGITHNYKDSGVYQELTDIARKCKDNNSEVCTIPFDVEISSLLCVFWEEDTSDWSVDGCEAYPAYNKGLIKCQCDHLSSFSLKYSTDDFFVEPVMISFEEDILLFLTVFENPVIVTVVIVVWVIYFFLVYMARKLDRKDVEQIGVVACPDNNVAETYVYVVCVMTGWWAQAGTTANVYLNIKGKSGTSLTKRLATTRPCFQSGGDDWFVFTTERSLGSLETVKIWHDNAGSSPHWYLNQVYVRDNQTGTAWTFIYNDWLAVDRGSFKQAVATIPLVSEEDMKFKKRYRLFVISTRSLRDGHQWLSIVTKSVQSSFTRVQRLTCGLSLLLTLMLTNLMFYGLPSDNPEDQPDAGVFSFSLRQFIIGIESSLIMFPINLIVLQLFIRVKQKPSKQKRITVSRGEKAKREPANIDPLSSYYLNLYKTKRFAKSRLYTNICTLYQKEKVEVRGDEIVAKYLKVCRQNMMWKALKNCKGAGTDHDITRNFTKQSFFLQSHKDHTKAEKVSEILIDFNTFDDTRQTYEVEPDVQLDEKQGTSRSRSDENKSKSKRTDTKKIFPWWFIYISWMVVMVICLTSSFFVMLYGLKYGYIRSVEWIISFLTGFLQGVFVEEPLKVIGISVFLALVLNKHVMVEDNEEDMELADDEEYLDEVKEEKYIHQPLSEPISGAFLKTIREKLRLEWIMTTTIWNIVVYIIYLVVLLLIVNGHNNNYVSYQNSQTLHNLLVEPKNSPTLKEVSKPRDFYNYMKQTFIPVAESLLQTARTENSSWLFHHMLGPYRIRQLRVEPGECQASLPSHVMTRCVDSYWYTREDQKNYLNSWTNISNSQDKGPWTYQDSADLKTLPYMGNHAIYSGGGYVKIFYGNALDEINDLEEKGWIDSRTRAIFLESTLYNPNTDLFSSVIFLFELTPAGVIYTEDDILSTNLHHHPKKLEWIFPACEILFVYFTLLFIYAEFKSYKKVGKREYFGNGWNYVELLQIALSVVIIGLFVQRFITVNNTLEEYSQNGNNHFTNFYRAFHWDSILKYSMAFLVALVTGKAIKIFNVNTKTKIIIVTLAKAKSALLGFLLIFVIASAAYSHCGYLLFGKGLFAFRSIHHSYYSNTLILFGSDIGLDLKDCNKFFGPIYFISFVLLIYYIVLQFCCTILNITRIITKFELAEKGDLHLIDFIMTNIRWFLSKK